MCVYPRAWLVTSWLGWSCLEYLEREVCLEYIS